MMYRLVSVLMLPSYDLVHLPDCHTGHLMSQLKDRIRVKLGVPPDVEIKLGYAAGLGNIVSVSDDDTVEHVVQEVVEHTIQTEEEGTRWGFGLLGSLGEAAAAAWDPGSKSRSDDADNKRGKKKAKMPPFAYFHVDKIKK